MYDGASDDLKLNGVYEFIGVLSRAPELAIAHMEAGEGCSCGSASDGGNVMHVPGCSATQELMEDEALGRLPTSLVSKPLHDLSHFSYPSIISLHSLIDKSVWCATLKTYIAIAVCSQGCVMST